MRERKLDPPLPPGWSKNVKIKHKTYEIDDAVRVLRNRLLGASLSILVFVKSGGARAQEEGSRIRRFLDKAWLDFNTGYPSARFVGTDAQVADGAWAAHLVWDHDWIDNALAAEDLEDYLRTHGLPFQLETPDALNAYVDFDRKKRPQLVSCIEQVPVPFLIGQKYTDADGGEFWLDYDKGTEKVFQSPTEPESYGYTGGLKATVTVATLEDASFVHRILINGTGDDAPVYGLGKWENLFGEPAWVFIPGDFSNSTDPLERWKPLVLGMYSMGQEVNMLRSARLNSGTLAGLPRLMLEPVEGDKFGAVGGDNKPELTFNEDGTVTVPRGWTVKPFEMPSGGDSMLENALSSVEMELLRYKPSPALRGVREEGVSSGYQQALIAEAAMTDLDPALEMQSAGIRQILQLVLKGAKAVDRVTDGQINTLYIQAQNSKNGSEEVLALKADEIDDYEITIKQSSMSPTSRIGMMEEGRRARAAGEIDDVTLYEEYYGYEDGVEMQRRATNQKMYDQLLPGAIQTALQIVQNKVAARHPTILGPAGEPISGPGMGPPQAQGVPAGAAAPGLDATLVQPAPPGPQPTPTAPVGGEMGAGSMT